MKGTKVSRLWQYGQITKKIVAFDKSISRSLAGKYRVQLGQTMSQIPLSRLRLNKVNHDYF